MSLGSLDPHQKGLVNESDLPGERSQKLKFIGQKGCWERKETEDQRWNKIENRKIKDRIWYKQEKWSRSGINFTYSLSIHHAFPSGQTGIFFQAKDPLYISTLPFTETRQASSLFLCGPAWRQQLGPMIDFPKGFLCHSLTNPISKLDYVYTDYNRLSLQHLRSACQ